MKFGVNKIKKIETHTTEEDSIRYETHMKSVITGEESNKLTVSTSETFAKIGDEFELIPSKEKQAIL